MYSTSSPHLPLAAIILFGAFVAWRLYRRAIRLVGRQRFSSLRSWSSLLLFPALALLLLLGDLALQPIRAATEVAGLVIGVGLAIYGLRHTKYEASAEGLYYTPHAHTGIALSLLLGVRVIYRFVLISSMPDTAAQPPQAFVQSPVTLLILGTLIGYYAWYALGLIRWSRAVQAAVPVPVAPPSRDS